MYPIARLPKIGVVAAFFFRLTAPKFFCSFFKAQSTPAANRTWSAFVPLCRWGLTEIQRLFGEQDICTHWRSNIAKITYIVRSCLAQREAAAASAHNCWFAA